MKMKIKILAFCLLFISVCILAAENAVSDNNPPAAEKNSKKNILKADFRQRPPEMIVDKNEAISGHLKDILEEAAAQVGYSIQWRVAPFNRSITELENGSIDIIPRTILTPEREKFANFLGPIGSKKNEILFAVKKGKEQLINSYDDLKKLNIGAKRGTAYFAKFDNNESISKKPTVDDNTLVQMLQAGRFDAVIILDKISFETAAEKIGFKNYSYAKYRYEDILYNYYGMSKKSAHASIFEKLNEILIKMEKDGRIAEIYIKYGLNS